VRRCRRLGDCNALRNAFGSTGGPNIERDQRVVWWCCARRQFAGGCVYVCVALADRWSATVAVMVVRECRATAVDTATRLELFATWVGSSPTAVRVAQSLKHAIPCITTPSPPVRRPAEGQETAPMTCIRRTQTLRSPSVAQVSGQRFTQRRTCVLIG